MYSSMTVSHLNWPSRGEARYVDAKTRERVQRTASDGCDEEPGS